MNLDVLARWLWEAYTNEIRHRDEPARMRLWQDLSNREQQRWKRVAAAAHGALRRDSGERLAVR